MSLTTKDTFCSILFSILSKDGIYTESIPRTVCKPECILINNYVEYFDPLGKDTILEFKKIEIKEDFEDLYMVLSSSNYQQSYYQIKDRIEKIFNFISKEEDDLFRYRLYQAISDSAYEVTDYDLNENYIKKCVDTLNLKGINILCNNEDILIKNISSDFLKYIKTYTNKNVGHNDMFIFGENLGTAFIREDINSLYNNDNPYSFEMHLLESIDIRLDHSAFFYRDGNKNKNYFHFCNDNFYFNKLNNFQSKEASVDNVSIEHIDKLEKEYKFLDI